MNQLIRLLRQTKGFRVRQTPSHLLPKTDTTMSHSSPPFLLDEDGTQRLHLLPTSTSPLIGVVTSIRAIVAVTSMTLNIIIFVDSKRLVNVNLPRYFSLSLSELGVLQKDSNHNKKEEKKSTSLSDVPVSILQFFHF